MFIIQNALSLELPQETSKIKALMAFFWGFILGLLQPCIHELVNRFFQRNLQKKVLRIPSRIFSEILPRMNSWDSSQNINIDSTMSSWRIFYMHCFRYSFRNAYKNSSNESFKIISNNPTNDIFRNTTKDCSSNNSMIKNCTRNNYRNSIRQFSWSLHYLI